MQALFKNTLFDSYLSLSSFFFFFYGDKIVFGDLLWMRTVYDAYQKEHNYISFAFN